MNVPFIAASVDGLVRLEMADGRVEFAAVEIKSVSGEKEIALQRKITTEHHSDGKILQLSLRPQRHLVKKVIPNAAKVMTKTAGLIQMIVVK